MSAAATPIADMVAEMLVAGLPHEAIVLAVRTAETCLSTGQSTGHPVDNAAEKRRAWDRQRRRSERQKQVSTGHPVDNADPPKRSPTPPKNNPQEPSSLRSEGPRATKRGSRLPDDWRPDEDHWAFAVGELGSASVVFSELDKFRDFWRAKPGKDGLKLDWPATWRNWCRRAVELRGRGPPARSNGVPRPGSREDRQERLSNVLATIDPRIRPDADDEGGSEGSFSAPHRLLPFGESN